jgi:hypothetical protein
MTDLASLTQDDFQTDIYSQSRRFNSHSNRPKSICMVVTKMPARGYECCFPSGLKRSMWYLLNLEASASPGVGNVQHQDIRRSYGRQLVHNGRNLLLLNH